MGKQYPSDQNLEKYDVFFEDNPKDTEIFIVRKLPEFISYGKTGFYIGYKDPTDKNFLFKNIIPM